MSSSWTQNLIRSTKFNINNCNSLKRLTAIAYTPLLGNIYYETTFATLLHKKPYTDKTDKIDDRKCLYSEIKANDKPRKKGST